MNARHPWLLKQEVGEASIPRIISSNSLHIRIGGGDSFPFPETPWFQPISCTPYSVYYSQFYTFIGSFQPIGMRAAATSPTPRSVASRLNWAAAFLVSCTSIRMPSALICFRVSGEMGCIEGPNPSINRSVFQSATRLLTP